MTDLLRDQLQASLGAAYTLERELGGGGMSRVFVARETTLGRDVVVKVLPPELAAGVSGERFRREIQLAAHLQHPNIVPVLSAGATGELLYYTMPFVQGESLRELLRRERQLPLEDALRIAREVADALDYAHRHAIVHRDIKPENILLEDGHAVVADFGIARALDRASGMETLTATGVSIGTLAYMSPEQATAQKELDGRSDVYSLGCVLYEMLAGEPPFTGPTPQAVLAKRVTSAPPSVRVVRAAVPASVERAITRAMAPLPADRFATARELELALAVGVSSGERPAAPRRRSATWLAAGGVAVAGIAALAIVLARRDRSAVVTNPDVVAVLPFRVTGADPSLGYLREGMVDLMAAKLTGEGGPRAADPRSVVSAWQRASDANRDDDATSLALRVAETIGAGQVLLGGVVGTPSRLVINASLLSVPDGDDRVEASVEGPPDSLPALIDRLTAQLLVREAGEPERLAVLTSTSLAALRSYLEGQVAYRQGRNEDAVRLFERSLEHDSAFVLAATGLYSAAYWTPNTEPFERGKRLAWAGRERLSARDRAYIEAWTGPRYPAAPSYSESLAGWQRAVEAAPDRPEPWFELGDVLFHFGPALGLPDANRRARSAFERAHGLDSTFAAPLAHLVELAAVVGDTAAARRLGALYFAQDSAADAADYVRWRTAHALGDRLALRTITDRFATLGTTSLRRIVGLGQLSGVGMDDVRRAAEVLRAREAPPSGRRLIQGELLNLELNSGRLAEAEAALRSYAEVEEYRGESLDMQVMDALFGDGDSVAAARAAARLAATPSAEGRRAALSHRCALALWRASRNDAGAAATIESLRQEGARVSDGAARDAATCSASAAVMLALRQARAAPCAGGSECAAAVARLESGLDAYGASTFGGSRVENVGRLLLARAREASGDRAGALSALRRRAYHHFATTYLATALREEGRLAEQLGDRSGGARAYRHYLELRPGADSVRAALARAAGERGAP